MQEQYFALLGRQRDISAAELESVYVNSLKNVEGQIAWLDCPVEVGRLGGAPRGGEFVAEIDTQTSFINQIASVLGDLARQSGARKFSFGISYLKRDSAPKRLNENHLKIKSLLKKQDFKVRTVPNKDALLNAAQVWNNKLDKQPNVELLIIPRPNSYLILRTTAIQNIDAYSRRDFQKPFRDSRSGMLPPKLAKTMVNLASPNSASIILDPFCGSGTVLMEAALLGHQVVGSDISTKMVEGTDKNLKWLQQTQRIEVRSNLFTMDARDGKWDTSFDSLVTEAYLGPPLTGLPANLSKIRAEVDALVRDFLRNVSKQINSGATLCLAIPSWYKGDTNSFIELPVVDDLGSLEYNPVEFQHAEHGLLYHRPDQTVGRRILVLKRK